MLITWNKHTQLSNLEAIPKIWADLDDRLKSTKLPSELRHRVVIIVILHVPYRSTRPTATRFHDILINLPRVLDLDPPKNICLQVYSRIFIFILQCGAAKRYKLVCKPHESYRYKYHKPYWNGAYLHQLNAIVKGGPTLYIYEPYSKIF